MRTDFPSHTRRTFLRVLLGGWGSALLAAVAWPAGRFLFPKLDREPDEVRVPLAVAEAIAPGGSAVFGWGSKPGILIRRDNGELVGFKGVCTHLDCNVTWKPDTRRFYCPCHQGWFDAEGRNIQGPPPRPLTPFILAVEGAELVVRTTPRPPEGGAA